MDAHLYLINGVSLGLEFPPDPDYGGICIVIDLFILRIIIGFPKDDQDDDAV
jgi:hypothetical protein